MFRTPLQQVSSNRPYAVRMARGESTGTWLDQRALKLIDESNNAKRWGGL